MDLEKIVQLISSGQQNEIHVWDKVVHYLCQNLDKHDLDEIRILSRSKLGSKAVHTTEDYFEALENNFSDKNDILEFLINLMGYMDLHTQQGTTKVENCLKKYREGLRKIQAECVKRGIFRDVNFVGREEEIKTMKAVIEEGKTKGILLCGLGGMGKTSIASTVCYELRGRNWTTIKIELREHKTFRNFLQTTINSIEDLRGSTAGQMSTYENMENEETMDKDLQIEENILQRRILSYFTEKIDLRQIFLFDNMEDITATITDKIRVMEFFKLLLEDTLQKEKAKPRIIITSQDDFLEKTESDNVSTHLETLRDGLEKVFIKIEVKQLDERSAKNLVCRCIKIVQGSLSERQMDSVVRGCLFCPFALRVICDIINNSLVPEDMKSLLEENKGSIPMVEFTLEQCIRKSFESLHEYKAVLCKLSLFGTSKFDLKSARTVVYGKHTEDEIQGKTKQERDLKLKLLLFKSRHLIEVENVTNFRNRINQLREETGELMSTEALFSLHPSVHNFLLERINDADFCEDFGKAKHNFIALLDELVVDIGKEYDKDVFHAREKAERKKVHIMKYLKLIEENKTQSNFLGIENAVSVGDIQSRSNIVKMMNNPENHLSFLKSMCAKHNESILFRYTWKLEHLSALINYESISCEKALCKLEHAEKVFKRCSRSLLDKEQRSQLLIMLGRIFYYKGLVLSDLNQDDSIKNLNEASKSFKTKQIHQKLESQLYLAHIYNCKGCLFYKEKNITAVRKAIKMHKKALNVLGKRHLKNENMISFYANIGACHFRLGQLYEGDQDTDNEKLEMKCAIENYNESIILARTLRMDKTFLFLRKLESRAKAHMCLNNFSEAEEDFNECLDICRILYKSPSSKEILIMQERGDLVRKWLIHSYTGLKRGEPDEYDLTAKGLLIYDEIKKILVQKPNIILGSHIINKIKTNHLYLLRIQKNADAQKAIKIFYSSYRDPQPTDRTDSPESTTSLSGSTHSSISSDDLSLSADEMSTRFDDLCNISDDVSSTSDSMSTEESLENGNLIQDLPDAPNDKMNGKYINEESTESSNLTTVTGDDFVGDTSIENPFKRPTKFALRLDIPQKNENRFRSSSSSGVSSMSDTTPLSGHSDVEKNVRLFHKTISEESDEVFDRISENNEYVNDASSRFSCSPYEFDLPQISGKKRKSESMQEETYSETIEGRENQITKKPKQQNNSTRGEDKSSQTDHRNLVSIMDELRHIEPFTNPAVRDLVKEIEVGNANVVDDSRGRPIVQYTDEVLK